MGESEEARRRNTWAEKRRARKNSLRLFLSALVHASTCEAKTNCPEGSACKKMKDLLEHRRSCKVRVRNGCETCKRILCLVQMHAKQCTDKDCKVFHCKDLKKHMLQQYHNNPLKVKIKLKQTAS